MEKKAVIAGAALLLLGGVIFYARRAAATATPAAPDPIPDVEIWSPAAASWLEKIQAWGVQKMDIGDFPMTETASAPTAQNNIAAFLGMIKKSEGTAGRADPYAVCYAYVHTITSFADHPAITGEWRGERLSDSMCAGAGLGPGCVSTAAGAYQIIKPTWVAIKRKLNLPDFSPGSQDAAATELLRQRGAINDVVAGRLSDAIRAARKEWASLAGAGYGQGERSVQWLTAAFVESGGVLA